MARAWGLQEWQYRQYSPAGQESPRQRVWHGTQCCRTCLANMAGRLLRDEAYVWKERRRLLRGGLACMSACWVEGAWCGPSLVETSSPSWDGVWLVVV